MTGWMTGRTDGKDDPPRTKPRLLYKKIKLRQLNVMEEGNILLKISIHYAKRMAL